MFITQYLFRHCSDKDATQMNKQTTSSA